MAAGRDNWRTRRNLTLMAGNSPLSRTSHRRRHIPLAEFDHDDRRGKSVSRNEAEETQEEESCMGGFDAAFRNFLQAQSTHALILSMYVFLSLCGSVCLFACFPLSFFFLSVPLSLTHTGMHARKHTHTHTRTHVYWHTHTHVKRHTHANKHKYKHT